MFLILAGWRSTDRESAVIDRMETMMKHAGVSVTMTSLTDTLSFLIGSMAPLPAVRILITWHSYTELRVNRVFPNILEWKIILLWPDPQDHSARVARKY
jgi:hypothetical protein